MCGVPTTPPGEVADRYQHRRVVDARAVRPGGFPRSAVGAEAIADTFGPGFTYVTASGSLAINTKVLHGFPSLTEDSIVWSRSERHWHRRARGDGPPA